MTITLPRLRFLAPLFAASVFCASALGGYFSSGSAGVLTACFLLFLLTAAVRPTRREWGVGAIPAALFAFFRTVGYSYDTTDSSDLLLKNAQTMLRGAAAMAALFAAALCAVVLLFRLLDALRAHAQSGAPATQKKKRRLFWLCAGLIFAGSIPYLLLYAPGLNIYDTHDQILQFFGFPSYIGDGSALSDHHPVFLTLIYGGFMKLGLLLGDANIGQLLYSLLSMAALAVCWAYALVTLREAGLARGAVIGLALFVALYPVLALYAFNMCKDVSVEPFVLLYGTMMFRLCASHGRAAQSGRFCAGLFAVALMMMLTRKPAMYALCFAALFLLLGYPGVRARLAGALLGAAAVFAVLYNGLLLPALGVIPGETREMLSVPFQQTARCLLAYPDDVTESELRAVSAVLDVENGVPNYDPRLADPVKDTSSPDLSGRPVYAGVAEHGDAPPRRLSGRMAEHDLRLFLSVGQQHHRLPDPQFAGCGRCCAAAEPGAFRRAAGAAQPDLFHAAADSGRRLAVLRRFRRLGLSAAARGAGSARRASRRRAVYVLFRHAGHLPALPQERRNPLSDADSLHPARHAGRGAAAPAQGGKAMKTERRSADVLLSAAMALVFGLIFYTFNTPLGPSIGSDNAMYLTLGTALARGYAPYTQIFDHKGPMLYLLQMLPQLLSGGYSTLAVFIQQVIALFLCLRVVSRIARTLGAYSGVAQLFYLALIASLVGGGNLTEEYASLPTLLGAYAALRVFLRPDWTKRLFAPALLMGVCTMAAFLLRANNALPLAALTLALALCLLAKKQFAPLGQCAAGFSAGLALCALPVVIWLAARGALRAAWYGAIVHNMRYTETGSTGRVAMLLHSRYGLAAMLMAVLACLGALALRKKSPMLALGMVAAAAAGALAAFLSRKFYDHYLILGAPMAVLGLAAALAAIQKPRVRAVSAIVLTCCCALWLGINGHAANRTRLSERADWAQFTADAQALMAQVPQDERDRFMAYRVEPRWYVAAEALPCMRFYFLQEVLAQADPAVMDEIVQTFETNPPRWLVIYYNRAFNPPYDARVAAIFETNYEFVDAAGQYQLLRLKEGLPCEPNS